MKDEELSSRKHEGIKVPSYDKNNKKTIR